MESIDESDREQDAEIDAEDVPFESEGQVSHEHLSGEVTVRAGSPVGATIAKTSERMTAQAPLSTTAGQWESENGQFIDDDHHWRMTWDQVENCHGLSISTCARPAADPSLPSSVSHSAMPHAIASPVRRKQPRNTVQVSHVLSGAPGYEGFTWRPGGPLFPMSFTGATGCGEGLSTGLEKDRDGNVDSFMTRLVPTNLLTHAIYPWVLTHLRLVTPFLSRVRVHERSGHHHVRNRTSSLPLPLPTAP